MKTLISRSVRCAALLTISLITVAYIAHEPAIVNEATAVRASLCACPASAGLATSISATAGFLIGGVVPSPDNLVPVELRCENIRNQLGIDAARPRLFWKLKSTKRSQTQTAFQILVASSAENLDKNEGDLWDSEKVASDQTIHIRYEGRPLKSSQQVFWKVRVWDKDGKVSPWSEPASWTMGLLEKADWQAKWITANRTDKDPLPIFRKSFRLDKPVRRAVIHICGLGHYELRLNGRRVGDYQMDPGWTNYRKTCLYRTYDVTNMLDEGDNVIGVMLGNGMYNVPGGRYTKFKGTFGPPKLICQMYVTFTDGSSEVIVSDQTWKYELGPILFTCIYGGEDYDARSEQTGWDKPGFDDSKWLQAKNCDGPGGKLTAQYAPPIKVADYLPAVEIRRLEEGKYEIDCGTNLSARPVIKVKGPSGSKVVITCAEKRGQPWLQDGGHVYNYTLKGEGEEVFRPRFTYFSFQYLYISGVERPNDAGGNGRRALLLDAGSEFLTSSAPSVGEFECSNTLFNDIDAMIGRSVRSNLQSVVTDCPHREKLGWLEVPHLMGPSIFYHRDVYNLYRKICRDTTESQLDNGLVPDIAPEYTRFSGGFFESPEWGSACVQLPELLYKWYGDNAIEQQQYETMKRYTLYLASTRNEKGLAKAGLGDWYDWTQERGHIGASQLTPGELTATAFLYDNARILNRAADRLGKKADADEFEKLARQVQRDFIKAYYKPADHSVATGSQAALATALYFGLVPEEGRKDVLANLVAKLEEANYRQSTGEVCFRMLVQALANGGRSDVVYRMINRTDAPGYGHMLKLGFKTLSERWDKPGSSMNHCMFGHIQEWFGNSILGIRQASDSVGFKRLLLRPEPVGDLTSASGYYDSIRGRIESRWRIENGCFYWHVTVPPNTTAELHVPSSEIEKITESGRPIDQSQDIVFLRAEPAGGMKESVKRAVFEAGSGEYEFASQLN
jgi:alpha-L-rhamnosidase